MATRTMSFVFEASFLCSVLIGISCDSAHTLWALNVATLARGTSLS